MSDFQDIKHLILKNHDIDSCIEYLLDSYDHHKEMSKVNLDRYADFIGAGKEDRAKVHFDVFMRHDKLADTAREGLGEAMYRNGTELHEHLAQYVHMVAPDRFEEEAQEYAQEQEWWAMK